MLEAQKDSAKFFLSQFLFMPTRKRTRAQRTESKLRRIPEHQKKLDGKYPVYEFTLSSHLEDDATFPTQVYMAPAEPFVQGFGKHSQTAIVMQALERYGAENARL